MNLPILAAAFVAVGLLTFELTRILIPRLIRAGIVGVDIHKSDQPLRAEMGGISILASSFVGVAIIGFLADPLTSLFFAGFLTIVLVGLVGVFDDTLGIRQRYKPFLVGAASIPLAVALLGRTSVNFPLIGQVPFGILYPLLIVPLAVTTSANFSNMLAGFNGLEAGIAAIAIATLTFLGAVRGSFDAVGLGIIFLAGYLAFLWFNWYPAKAFPGDTGTLMAGATIATIGLVGQMEFAAIVVSIPAALDFTLKMIARRPFSQRSTYGNTVIVPSGALIPASYPALAHAFLRVGRLTEKRLVESLLAMELIFAALAAVLTIALL